MRFKLSLLIQLVLVAIGVVSAGAILAESQPPLRIGAILPLTGPTAFVGQGTLKGLSLARDLINAQGGVAGHPIELVIEDSRSEPAAGVAAFQKLVNLDKVKIIYSALTSVSMAIRPLAEKEDVLVFAQSVHPKVLQGSTKLLRTFFTVEEADARLVEWLRAHSLRRLGLLYAEEDWGEATKRDLLSKSLSGDFVLATSLPVRKDASDLRTELARFRLGGADAVYIAAIGPVVGTIAKQMAEMGFNVPNIYVSGCSQSPFFGQSGMSMNGFDIAPSFDAKSPMGQTLLEAFHKAYPEATFVLDPHILASFDALHMLKKASEAASSVQPQELRKALIALPPYAGVLGQVDFDEQGEIKSPMRVIPIQQGKCVVE